MLKIVTDKIRSSIAEQLYAKNAELVELNYALTLIQDAENIVQSSRSDIDLVLKELVQKILVEAEFTFFGLFLHGEKSDNYYNRFGKYDPINAVNSEPIKITYTARLVSNAASLINHTDDRKIIVGEVFDVVEFKPYAKNVAYIKKLPLSGDFFGFFLYSTPDTELTSLQKQILTRLTRFIGPSLENLLLTEELRDTTRILKATNDKLLALDEAKDEFISMASHQLRTPLTSVKGYVSMVLEGDAGKLAPMQRQLLEQAFTSSQRMVYLIADLLNVSRLKTGKFIIESKPTYLPDVVEGEVDQLMQTAAVRNLKLIYNKPKNFPIIAIDETKIRQVCMNFIDNAIYYTPSGGKIVVDMKATEDTIEYTVTDNGIGVPKSQRPHLFTKFYRADNARKARPDGTGLGLFMAKKVIIAQGGSIIFRTEEGKGSIFGFTFPRAKVEVAQQK